MGQEGLEQDLLELLYAPFVSPEKARVQNLTNASEAENAESLADVFFNEAVLARYSVYQLIGREVKKEGDQFVLSNNNWSHSEDKDLIRGRMKYNYPLEILDLEKRRKKLSQLWSLEQKTSETNQIGVVSLFIENVGNYTDLIIYGPFSVESRPLASDSSMRPDADSSIYFRFNGKFPKAISMLMSQLTTNAQNHDSLLQNREKIVEAISRIFPDIVMEKVKSHMLKELEIFKIFDFRETESQ